MNAVKLNNQTLVHALRLAYSAERAAAYAYIGHQASLADPVEKARVAEIEQDEWGHRREVRAIMDVYGIKPSTWFEFKYALIGRIIGVSCFLIGRFMPYFFAGKLESGNVCEYIVMMQHFRKLGITEHDDMLYAMGLKEKAHEVYFESMIQDAKWLPIFEKLFGWGAKHSLNDVDAVEPLSVEQGGDYCRGFKRGKGMGE